MIHIAKTGICHGCEKADLELESFETENFNGVEKHWSIRCIHQQACERIYERLDNEVTTCD